MENKVTKNLIILGIIVFSFIFTNSASAYCQRYAFSNRLVDRNCVEEEIYYNNYESNSNVSSTSNNQNVTPDNNVVNNYYYYPTTTKTTTSNTSTAKSTVDTTKDNSNSNSNYDSNYSYGESDYNNVYSNGLGASVYDSGQNGNGITALSLKGSGSFMPSSIWQWILTVILILIIIIIARMFVTKPNPADHDSHVAHAH